MALVFACGRPSSLPPSAQQAGTAPPSPSVADKLNAQVNAELNKQRDASAKMDDLRLQIQSTEQQLSQSKATEQSAISSKVNQYASSDLEAQRQDFERDLIQSQLQQQIQKQAEAIQQLSGIVLQERNWGFDSPALDENSARLAQEQQNLANLQNQSLDLKQQAGQIAVLRSEDKRWREGTDQQQFDQSYQQQQAQLTQELQRLNNQYNAFADQQQKSQSALDDLQQQLFSARAH